MNELDRLPKILRLFFISRTFKTSFFQNRLYTKELTPDTFYFFQNQYSILFKINTRGTVSHFAGSFLKENEVSWRSIFYSISSTRISIKSALLGSNLYYYFTVGKARIRSACNFVIMVIVAILFKDSNHRFLTCPIIVSIKVTSLMNIHPLSNPCHCARRIKTNRSASRGGQKLVPTTFYSRSTSRIPVADNRASVKSWISGDPCPIKTL